jgi:O-antigen/teichoic acid export membrane protein
MESGFRPALLLMAGRAAGCAASFVIPVVLVRIFDQAEFGAYKQLFLVAATLSGIAQVGMAESLFYFVPLRPREAGRCVLNAVLVLAAAGTLCLALLWQFGDPLARALGNEGLARFLPAVGLYLLLTLMATVLEIVLTARRRYVAASCAYAVSDVARALLFVLPVLVLRRIEDLLAGAVLFAVLRCVAALLVLRREFGGDLRPDVAVLRSQIAYALPFGMAALVGVVESSLHLYGVSHRFDAATFAVYSVGCLQIPLVDLVAGSACNVMMVRMGEEMREGRREAVLEAWHDTTRRLALVFFPMAGLLITAAPPLIVVLFTRNYLASVPIFSVWTATIAFAAFQVDGLLRVLARTRFLLALYLAKLAFIALLIGPFLSIFHLVGAVLITALALALAKAACLVRIARLLEVTPARLLPWRSLAGTAAGALLAALVATLVRAAVHLPAFPLLIVTGLVYAATFAGCRIAWGALAVRIPGSAGLPETAGAE